MTIRAVVFDLGGVLYHQDGVRIREWEYRLGLEEGQLTERVFMHPAAQLAVLGQVTPERVWSEVGRQLSLTPSEIADLEGDFWLDGEWDVRLLEFIRSLRPGIRTGLLSDAWLDARQRVELAVGTDTFDVMMFSAEEGIKKPGSAIFQRVLERLGTSPGETIFVDDRLPNVLGAQRAGMLALQHRARERTIDHITEMLGAGS